MQKAAPLIRTKLHPPFIRSGLVARPRLLEQIAQGLRRPLTLVTAPAGFGKTTLVALGLSTAEMPVAWLSLDKEDNRPGRFLSYLIAAFQEVDRAAMSGAAELLSDTQEALPEAVLTSLINDLETSGKEFALVLDDYHFISSQAVHSAVAFLLDHSPRLFHLVIASRSDPPLPFARLRARGQMIELRAAELSFTEPEAAQFLNEVMGLHLDARSVAALEERTEGWIAGLQMAALSMRDRKDIDGFIAGFSGTNRYILDYLLEEVLASQPPEIQHFLLHTSILERLTAPLCNAVLECEVGPQTESVNRSQDAQLPFNCRSASILEYLERVNLFLVPLDDDHRWYRYHHLFADLLQARLRQQGADQVEQLLSRAAGWCEREGQVADAVGYALAAQDYPRAAGLIAQNWPVAISNGEIETVWAWVEALPEDTVRNNAPLSVAYCWVLWFKGQTGAIEPHLVDAENALSKRAETTASSDDATYIGLPSLLATLRSIVARYGDDFDSAVALAERALHLIPEKILPQGDAQLRGVIFMALASAYDARGDLQKAVEAYHETIRWSRLGSSPAGIIGMTYRLFGVLRLLGRLRAAEEACRETLDYIQQRGMSRLPAVGLLHLTLSEVFLERNELDTAEVHLSRGMELGRWSGRFDAVRNAASPLARLRQARHDEAGALAAIQQAEAVLERPTSPLEIAEFQALQAKALVRQGALTEAARCVEKAIHLAGRDRGQTGQRVAVAASRVMAAQGKAGEAIEGLTQSISAAETAGWIGAVIEMLILRSLAYARQGKTQPAEADLERALALAEPEGFVRIFIDEGQPVQLLLAQWLAHASAGTLRDYTVRLLSQFDTDKPLSVKGKNLSADVLAEPLSQRELEVLHLMALGRTNQEIARQLIVSPGTVKAHTASIYRKLDVANRTEAVDRARRLGILP